MDALHNSYYSIFQEDIEFMKVTVGKKKTFNDFTHAIVYLSICQQLFTIRCLYVIVTHCEMKLKTTHDTQQSKCYSLR